MKKLFVFLNLSHLQSFFPMVPEKFIIFNGCKIIMSVHTALFHIYSWRAEAGRVKPSVTKPANGREMDDQNLVGAVAAGASSLFPD